MRRALLVASEGVVVCTFNPLHFFVECDSTSVFITRSVFQLQYYCFRILAKDRKKRNAKNKWARRWLIQRNRFFNFALLNELKTNVLYDCRSLSAYGRLAFYFYSVECRGVSILPAEADGGDNRENKNRRKKKSYEKDRTSCWI